MPHSKPKEKVLIVAGETVIAALLGLLLELEEYEPVFALADERLDDAIRRIRPPLVIVLDGELDAAQSDLFFARATASGSRVVLFSQPGAVDTIETIARERRVPYFSMPVDRAALRAALARSADA